nr:glycosyltransferase family 4 protein [Mangrovicoccus sp. HB161399]
MRPGRVVIVNDASTARGGATGLAILSAELLTARGIPVTFIAGDDGVAERLRASGVEVIALGDKGLVAEKPVTAAARGLYHRRARRALAEWIARHDGPEVVYHLHGWSKILSPAVLDGLRPVATRTLIHAHDFFLACPNGGFMDYRSGLPCKLVPLGADCLATNCDKRSYGQKLWRVARQGILRSRLKGAAWAEVLMIHAGMAPYLMMSGIEPGLLAALPNPSSALVPGRVAAERNRDFLFIGRIEAEKGVEDAIDAARLARVRLRVVGDGPLRESLAARFPEVDFLGWMSREEMAPIVAEARVLIMPSRYPEPYGLVVAEALRSGLPVILAETALLSEQVVRQGIGLSCDTRDPASLAAAICVLRDMPPAEMESISRAAQSGVGEISTTPEQWVEALLRHYGAALAASRCNRRP